MKLSLNKITRLLAKAFEKKQENKAWQIYVSKYPHFTKDDYKPFEEFYNPQETSDKSEKEILEEVKGILDTFKKEGDENRDI